QIAEDIVIGLAKRRVGIEHIGIGAAKVIVTVSIEMRNRVWIDISCTDVSKRVWIVKLKAVRQWVVGVGIKPARPIAAIDLRKHVTEHVIIFFRLIVQIVTTGAEIERAGEVRRQAEFLTELPGMFLRQIFDDQSIRAAQLRIACDAGVLAIGKFRQTGVRIYRKSKIGEDVLRGGLPGNVGRILEEPWHGPEAVVVFGRKEEIVTKAGLRG